MNFGPTIRIPLAEGDPGTAQTTQLMRQKIDEGKVSSVIRAKALDILNAAHVKAFDAMGQARAVYGWVLRNVKFIPDVVGKESVQTAEWTLHYGRGDCDCISVLMCALLETIGMRCRLMTVASDPRDPQQFSHVYPEVNIGGRWTAVDAARRSPAFGRSPANYFRKRWWGSTGEWGDMGRLGMMPMAQAHALITNVAVPGASGPVAFPPNAKRLPRLRLRRRSMNGLRGLGQTPGDAFNFSQLAPDINAATTGIANVISASRANPSNLTATTQTPIYNAQGQIVGYNASSAAPGSFFGMSIGTWLLIGLAVAGIAIAEQR